MEILSFVLGVFFIFSKHALLPVACVLLFYIQRQYLLFWYFFLGILICLVHLWLLKPQGLPQAPVIPQAIIQGSIASIPVHDEQKLQFELVLERLNDKPAKALLQLAWYSHSLPVHVGERWQFIVKLKQPHNFTNPGSSDYARMLTSKHIDLTGYIRPGNNLLLSKPQSNWHWLSLREQLATKLQQLAPNKQSSGILQALTLNINSDISQELWSLFRRTGTTHLFGISGEHIALISGLIFALISRLWSGYELGCLRIPAQYIASVAGLVAASCYALLAGFGPPVQRALIACVFYTCYCLGKQRFSSWQMWRYALIAVVALEPHVLFMQGFYFSFLAVACIVLTQQRWQKQGYRATLVLQLSCLVGLMPLTLYWYAYGSINGFIANLFAIPLVGLLIVPLALISLLLAWSNLAWLMMQPLSWLIAVLIKGLTWTEQLAFINVDYYFDNLALVIGLMGALCLWILMPIKPFRALACLWLLLPLLPSKPPVLTGEALINVLDVGQGLAVVVRTAKHVLLYDTGDQFLNGNNLGTLVVLPFLRSQRSKHIDKIIISHPDQDHRGGLQAIIKTLAVDELLVNDPSRYRHALSCHHYPSWQWDGVAFRLLPLLLPLQDRNNSSCILQISTAAGRVLFTGDIEKKAEQYLVQHYGSELRSEVLLVPHHGSKTSSSYRFLLEVAPQYAIISLGFDNRFGFPHSQTMARMKSMGIGVYRTDASGMVTVKLPQHGRLSKPYLASSISEGDPSLRSG